MLRNSSVRSLGRRSRTLSIEHLEKLEMCASDTSTLVNFDTVPSRVYELRAERLPIPGRGVDAFGHGFLTARDVVTGQIIGQLHGFAIDPLSPLGYRDKITTAFGAIGGFGDKTELIQTNLGTNGNYVSLGTVSATKLEILEDAYRRFQQFTQTSYLPYAALPAKYTVASKSNPKVDIEVSTYNSNSVFGEILDITQFVVGFSPETQAQLQRLYGAGLGSPGIDDDISKDFRTDFTKAADQALLELDMERFKQAEQSSGLAGTPTRQKVANDTYLSTYRREDGVTVQVRARYGFKLELLQSLESTIVTGADLIVNRATEFASSVNRAATEITVGVWDGLKTLKGDDIARELGSHVSEALVTGNSLVKRLAGNVGGKLASALFAAGQDLSQALSTNSVDAAILQVMSGYRGVPLDKLSGQVQKEIKDGISSIIVGQLAEKLGVSGAQGVAFTNYSDAVLKNIASQVINVVQNKGSVDLEKIFMDVKMANVSSAVGQFLGNKLSGLVGDSKTAGQALASAIGSSFASVSYTTSVASWLTGTVAAKGLAAATNLLGITVGNAVLNAVFPFLGAIITSFAGSTIGKYLGGAIDLLTGGWLSRKLGAPGWHYRYFSFESSSNQLTAPSTLDFSKKTTADLRRGTNMLADSTLTTLNPILDELGIIVDVNGSALPAFAWLNSSKPQGANDYQIRRANDRGVINAAGDFGKLVRIGVEDILTDLKYSGGDPLKVRAFESWKATSKPGSGDALVSLLNNLAVARDYAAYLAKPLLVNAMIEADPNSLFSIGWTNLFVRAQSMGLDKVVATSIIASVPSNTVAGAQFNIDLKATTPDGKPTTNFSGWFRVSVDGQETMSFAGQINASGILSIPQRYTTSGKHVVEVKLGAYSLGQFSIEVKAATAVRIQLTATEHTVAGKAISMTVTAFDQFGNIAIGYVGTVKLTTNDTTASLPSSLTFTSSDRGTRTISATFETQGDQVVHIPFKKKRVIINPKNLWATAEDTSNRFSSTVTIQAGS